MLQQELFPDLHPSLNLKSLLQQRAADGKLFYKLKEVARMFRLSGFQVHWAIKLCRLDALFVCGEYRIPWFSILDWVEDHWQIKRQFWTFQAIVNAHAKSDIYVSESSSIYEEAPQDYYCLPDLYLPNVMSVYELSLILEVPYLALQQEMNVSGQITWPEVLDFLIEREFVNLPVFARKEVTRIKTMGAAEDDQQLSLFEEKEHEKV